MSGMTQLTQAEFFLKRAAMSNTTFKEFLEIDGTPEDQLDEAKKKKKRKSALPKLAPHYLGWLGPRYRVGIPWSGCQGAHTNSGGPATAPAGGGGDGGSGGGE